MAAALAMSEMQFLDKLYFVQINKAIAKPLPKSVVLYTFELGLAKCGSVEATLEFSTPNSQVRNEPLHPSCSYRTVECLQLTQEGLVIMCLQLTSSAAGISQSRLSIATIQSL